MNILISIIIIIIVIFLYLTIRIKLIINEVQKTGKVKKWGFIEKLLQDHILEDMQVYKIKQKK